MKKFLLIPLLALFTCVNAWGTHVDVSSASGLTTELTKENPADTINVTANCTLTVSVDFKHRVIMTAKNKRLALSGTATYSNLVFRPNNFGVYVYGTVTLNNADISNVAPMTVPANHNGTDITLLGNITIPKMTITSTTTLNNETNVTTELNGCTSALALVNKDGSSFTFASTTSYYPNLNITNQGTGKFEIEAGAQFKKSAWDGCSALATYCTNNNLYPEPWAVSGEKYVKVFAAKPNPVAKIGDDEYPTLYAAAVAASENATIALTDNAVNEAEVTISKNLTIDGGTGACKTLNCYFNITGADTLKLINVAVEPTAGSYAVQLIKDSKLILSNAHVKGRSGNSAIKVSTSTANTTCQIESEANTSNSIKNTASSSSYTINGNRCEVEFMGPGNLLVEHKGTSGYLFGGSNGKFKLNAPNAIYTYETASCNVKNTATDAVNHLQGIYSTVIESYEESGHTVYPVSNANQLKLALNTASDNDVIRLNEGLIALKEQIVIDKTLTIDFRGCRLYSENMMNIDNLIKVGKDALSTNTVTFMSSGALEGGIYTYSLNAAAIEVYSNAIFERGLIENKHPYYTTIDANHIELLNCHALRLHSGANVTINGGTFKSQRYAVYAKGDDASKDINLTINGGEFQVVENQESNAAAVAVVGNTESETAYNATVTINGGTFSGAYSGVNVLGKGAVLNVTGGSLDGRAYAIAGNGRTDCAGTVINISGGTIGSATTEAGIFHPQGGELRISGDAHIIGKTGVQLCAGYASTSADEVVTGSISGGIIEAVGSDNRATKEGDGLIPDGAAVSVVNRNYPGGTPQFQIVSGVFKSNQGAPLMAYTWSNSTNQASAWPTEDAEHNTVDVRNHLQAIGGYFSANPYAYVLEDYTVAEIHFDNGDYWMVHKGGVAERHDFDDATDVEVVKLVPETSSENLAVNVGNGTNDKTQTAEYVEVADNVTLIVKDKAILNVGDGGLVLTEENSKFVIEEGGVATVGSNGIVSTAESNIEIKLGENKQGALLIDPNVTLNTQPKATVILSTNCKMKAGDPDWIYKYQRFAIPVKDAVVPTNDFDPAINEYFDATEEGYGFESYVFSWNGNAWGTNHWGDLEPFVGYQLANNSKNGGVTYTFTGNLMGNNDGSFDFTEKGFDFFGNSYTAPIYIKNFLEGFGSDVEATVWVYNDEGSNFEAITVEDIEDGFASKTEINSMEGFILNLRNANTGSAPVDYSSAIWGNPRFDAALGRSSAPVRKNAVETAFNSAVITIVAENGKSDKVTLVEKGKYTAEFDNGADASKYMNEGMNVYAVVGEEKLARVATDDLMNTSLSFRSDNSTNYTLQFSNVEGEDYMLRDNVTGQTIAFDETYTFTQSANTTAEGRFQIVEIAKMPTSIENTEVKANVKGIYTITGAYVGEDLNLLPAGLYIVNGVKIVK